MGTIQITLVRAGYGLFFGVCTFITFPIRFFFRWITTSWRHRRFQHLLQGLPALLMLGVVVGLALAADMNTNSLSEKYLRSAKEAAQQERYEAAELYYERVIDLQGLENAQRSHLFELAYVLSQRGHDQRTLAMMRDLAPGDHPGYGRAHVWLAQKLITESDQFRSSDHVRAALQHLQHARRRFPESADVTFWAGQCYLALGATESAGMLLERAADLDRKYQFELWQFYQATGRTEDAMALATRGERFYRDHLLWNPQDDDARMRLAILRGALNDIEGSIHILRERLALSPDPHVTQLLAEMLLTLYDHLGRNPEVPLHPRFELLREALTLSPNSSSALSRLAAYGLGKEDEKVNEYLHKLLAAGHAPHLVHFVKGIRAWETNKVNQALFNLERAYQLDPNMAPVANNLAWVLAHGEEPDLERALQIIDSVLKDNKEVGVYRDTRGQILVKMGRWNEAIDDLRFALRSIPNNRQLHEALALSYEQLGQKTLARQHRTVAASLVSDAEADEESEGADTGERPDLLTQP